MESNEAYDTATWETTVAAEEDVTNPTDHQPVVFPWSRQEGPLEPSEQETDASDDQPASNDAAPEGMAPEVAPVEPPVIEPHGAVVQVEDSVPQEAEAAEPDTECGPALEDAVSLADATAQATTPAELPADLMQTLAASTPKERRNKKRHPVRESVVLDSQAHTESQTADTEEEESYGNGQDTTPDVAAFRDEEDDPAWRLHWPSNELVLIGMLEPQLVPAPAVDGVTRFRANLLITEIDAETGQSGVVAKVPIQILPMARGFEPIYNQVTRARRLNRQNNGRRERLQPFYVEVRGVSKRLPDQDRRYATVRRTTLFGLEVSALKQVARETPQFGRWRGIGTVAKTRPFEFEGVTYLRATLNVPSTRRKSHLRGGSAHMDQADVLVHKGHPHYRRFKHIGQRLLVEAEVTSQTSVMRDTHPALEGLEEKDRQRLQTLRQGLVIATMGEFPDEAAEAEYTAWALVGHPGQPGRPGRRSVATTRQRDQRRSRGIEAGPTPADPAVSLAEAMVVG
jgi:hypothetical protein